MLLPLGFISQGGGAGGGAGAFELISTQVLTTDTASITFSSIPSIYKHLQVRFTARGTSGTSAYAGIRLNGDTGSNYAYHYLQGNGSSVSSTGGSSSAFGPNFLTMPWSSSTAGAFAGGIIDLLDYTSTNKNKTLRAFNGWHDGTNAQYRVQLHSGLYMSTAAVTSLTLTEQWQSFVSGSRFSLYGVKG